MVAKFVGQLSQFVCSPVVKAPHNDCRTQRRSSRSASGFIDHVLRRVMQFSLFGTSLYIHAP
jgi:hypothetical protein